MTTTWTIEQLEHWIDRHAIDKAGHRLGTVADVYVDDATGQPEWLAIMTGLFGSRISFVPLQGTELHGDKVQVAWDKSTIKASPSVDADGQLSEDEERRLYGHYGIAYTGTQEPVIDATEARETLEHRDEEAVEAIDLTAEDLDLGSTGSTEEESHRS